jgi:gluconolactonase
VARIESAVEVLVSGYQTPEGPAFDRDGNLFFVNWELSAVMRVTPEGDVSEFFNTGGIPAGLAFHPDGSLYIADEGEHIHGMMRVTMDGESEIVVNEFEGKPLNGANDLVFDRAGVLYFSDPWGSSDQNPIGGFYRRFPDGRLEQIDSGLAFPNGVALNADETAVYLAETFQNRILRYAINNDGSLGAREVWADVPLPPGADGMAFDADGNLYVAHFNGSCVEIFDPNGQHIDKIDVPGHQVTNCAFGGDDNRTLVITDVATKSLYKVRVAVGGQPLNDGRTRAG